MKTKHLILLALALEAAVLADEPPPVSQWIPSEAVVVLEINKPEALLDALLSEDLEKAVTNLPQYQAFTAVPQFRQVRGITQIIEAQLDADWRTALRKLVGRGLCIAVGAGGEMLLSVECQDKALLEQAHKSVQAFASAAAANKSPSEAPASKEYRGVTTWSFGPKEAHAIVGDRFLLANNSQALEHALDLRAGSGGQSLASRAAYKDAVNALGSDAVARLFVDMGALKQAPRIKQALARGGEPLGVLLTAGTRDPLDSANWLGLGLYVKGDTLTLRAVNDGKLPDPATPSGFATPRGPQDGAWPNLRVARQIAGISLYRDMHGFYAAKDQLFPERTSGLIFFENMMGIFFSGRDLTEEVLGVTKPEIRFVVARQQYDPAVGTPGVQVPAFAAVLRLKNPEASGELAEEAWQKALGLINFTQGQKALPGMIMDRVIYRDTKYTVSFYRRPPNAGQPNLDLRYNFRPALARRGEYLIMSSTDKLAEELIDAVSNETSSPPKASHQTHSLVEVDGDQLLAILRANRENFVRQNALEKGRTPEQASVGVNAFLTLVDTLKHAKLTIGQSSGRPEANLTLQLRAPDAKRIENPPALAQASAAR